MSSIDRTALLQWLRTRAAHSRPVVHAVLTGLADRIERGDFDTTNKTTPGSGQTLTPGPKQPPLKQEGGAV
jgi:hypothetical protein